MRHGVSAWRIGSAILIGLGLAVESGVEAQSRGPNPPSRLEVTPAVHHDVSPPLRDIQPKLETGARREVEVGRVPVPPPGPATRQPDVLQQSVSFALQATTGLNFDGVGKGSSFPFTVQYAPPDINGAVGATQYVQWVNTSFAVFDKTTGAKVYGPAAGNTIWSGFGGGCQNNNDGDPIVQYDKAAGRWIMTQFSVDTQPSLQCVAVSQTSDATGAWYRYSFQYSNFPDYPKLAVWPDAYYIAFNMFGGNFLGPRACAYDRARMLTGAAATQICFQLGPSAGSLLPSDLDGTTPPPAGSPNFFMSYGTNQLWLWKFHVDFATPANSTLVGPTSIPVNSFSAACGGGECIPQSGTSQKLDSLADRLMYRLAYRRFADHESLVVNHAVTAGASAGIRWYEVRDPNGSPVVYQQSTYAPDSSYRWMGSAAMDKVGNLVVGYSVSSGSMKPAVRFAGREADDPLNTLSAETDLKTGLGAQTTNLSRWGDYSSMSVDPIDDCTFWYTNEYLQTNGTFNWSTRIANFSFASCTGATATPDFSLSATPASRTVTVGGSTTYTATVAPLNGFTHAVSLSVTGLPSGASGSFSPNPVPGGSGSSSLTVTTAAGTTPGSYTLTITGSDGATSHTAQVTLVVNAPVTGDFSISAAPASRSIKRKQTTTYDVTITPSGGFTSGVTLSVTGVPSNTSSSFSVNPVPNGSGASKLTITTSNPTPRGTFTLTITGAGGSKTHSTSVSLRVR